MELRVCVFCGEERLIERPECLDGHGEDCPEAFCAECGSAVWNEAFRSAEPALVRASAAP